MTELIGVLLEKLLEQEGVAAKVTRSGLTFIISGLGFVMLYNYQVNPDLSLLKVKASDLFEIFKSIPALIYFIAPIFGAIGSSVATSLIWKSLHSVNGSKWGIRHYASLQYTATQVISFADKVLAAEALVRAQNVHKMLTGFSGCAVCLIIGFGFNMVIGGSFRFDCIAWIVVLLFMNYCALFLFYYARFLPAKAIVDTLGTSISEGSGT